MAAELIAFKNSTTSKVLFFISVGVLVYWCVGGLFDVYRFAVVGAIYEILWVFMLITLFVVPILSLIFWIKERFNFRSLYLYAILIPVINILLLVSVR